MQMSGVKQKSKLDPNFQLQTLLSNLANPLMEPRHCLGSRPTCGIEFSGWELHLRDQHHLCPSAALLAAIGSLCMKRCSRTL